MARRLISTLLILLMASALFAAVDISGLPLEKQDEYLGKFLSVRTGRGAEILLGALAIQGGQSAMVSTGALTGPWTPYQGAEAITRADFLYLAGESELAAALQAEYERTSRLNSAGYICFGVGVIGVAGSLIWGLCSSNGASIGTPFIVAAGISGALTCISIPLMTVRANDDISISFAINLADQYNQKLYESLK